MSKNVEVKNNVNIGLKSYSTSANYIPHQDKDKKRKKENNHFSTQGINDNNYLETIQKKDEEIIKRDKTINEYKMNAKKSTEEGHKKINDLTERIENLNLYIKNSSESYYSEKIEIINDFKNQIKEMQLKHENIENELNKKIELFSVYFRNRNLSNQEGFQIENCKYCMYKDSQIQDLKSKIGSLQEYIKNQSINNYYNKDNIIKEQESKLQQLTNVNQMLIEQFDKVKQDKIENQLLKTQKQEISHNKSHLINNTLANINPNLSRNEEVVEESHEMTEISELSERENEISDPSLNNNEMTKIEISDDEILRFKPEQRIKPNISFKNSNDQLEMTLNIDNTKIDNNFDNISKKFSKINNYINEILDFNINEFDYLLSDLNYEVKNSNEVIIKSDSIKFQKEYNIINNHQQKMSEKIMSLSELLKSTNNSIDKIKYQNQEDVFHCIERILNQNTQHKTEFVQERKKLILNLIKSEKLANECIHYVEEYVVDKKLSGMLDNLQNLFKIVSSLLKPMLEKQKQLEGIKTE